MDKPRTCASCRNRWTNYMCERGLTKFDKVRGEQTIVRTCEFERSALWGLFIDTCGPSGVYWRDDNA